MGMFVLLFGVSPGPAPDAARVLNFLIENAFGFARRAP
jgi:hypothetical protein